MLSFSRVSRVQGSTLDALSPLIAKRRASKAERLIAFGLPLARVGLARVAGPRLGRVFPVTAHTFWGADMRVMLPENLSSQVAAYGYFEPGLTTMMLSRVEPKMTVYDVGAHYGYFTLLASHIVGDGGHVHSFEPTPSTYAVLSRNAARQQNVTANNLAVWHENSLLTMRDFGYVLSMYNSLLDGARLPDGAAGARPAEHEVSAVSLDNYALEHPAPDFVKIDAESAELHVLEGMDGLLRGPRPTITLEVGDLDVDGAPSSRTLLDHVVAYGYTPFEYRQGKVVPHELRDRYRYDNILLSPDQ